MRPEDAGEQGTSKSEPSGTGALNVLLAEDNALNQIVGVAVLERLGHKVTIADDGAEAVAAVRSQPSSHFNVVLMDLHMPEVDGLEATRQIRALPQGAGLPILALTAAAMTEDRDKCLAAGMDGHIAKPLEPEELKVALRQILPASHASPPPGREQPRVVSASETPAAAQELPDLPTIDLMALMARIQHNRALAWTLLAKFVEQNRATAQELETLLGERQLDKALFVTHNLMGSAANLGATQVAQASATLNAALRNRSNTPEMLPALQEALRASLADAKRALSQQRH